MKKIAIVFINIFLFFLFADEVKAIIILPAIILVPIAKLVAVIITGFSLPVVGLSAYWHKLNNRPILRGVFVGLLVLIVIGVIIAMILKMVNPSRPLF